MPPFAQGPLMFVEVRTTLLLHEVCFHVHRVIYYHVTPFGLAASETQPLEKLLVLCFSPRPSGAN